MQVASVAGSHHLPASTALSTLQQRGRSTRGRVCFPPGVWIWFQMVIALQNGIFYILLSFLDKLQSFVGILCTRVPLRAAASRSHRPSLGSCPTAATKNLPLLAIARPLTKPRAGRAPKDSSVA